jgi:hypothetical protein
MLSFFSPVALPRAEGQEESSSSAPRVTTLVVPTRLESLSALAVPRISTSTPRIPEHAPDFARFTHALDEHEAIFGERSNVLLVWPDHYLSYEPSKGITFNSAALQEHLEALSSKNASRDSFTAVKYEDAISTVRSTTSFVGAAAFSISDYHPESPPLVAVVGYDSSRPRSLVLKSLAGITCPTVMLTQMISRDDLHSFVRLHESGHAFQHTEGRVKDGSVETSYERCIIEAEADVFATLWWLKTRHGDASVPTYFAHLRSSNYFEYTARACEEATIQYATYRPLRAALEVGAYLEKNGSLSAMSAAEIHMQARKIVALSLPPEHQLRDTTALLKATLHNLWQHPFHTRIGLVTELLTAEAPPVEIRESLQWYLESVNFLTDPKNLTSSFPELSHLPLAEQAEHIWVNELINDLEYAVTPSLVIERYSNDLSAAALAVWRLSSASSDGEDLKRIIQIDGSPEQFFVPTGKKDRYLEIAQQILLDKMNDDRLGR